MLHPGIMLESAEGEKIGESKIAARQGISMVILSRIGMATPGMVCRSGDFRRFTVVLFSQWGFFR